MTSRLSKFERNKTDCIEEMIKSRLAYKMCTNYPTIKIRSSRRRICLYGEVFKCLSKLIMRLLRLIGRLRSYDGYRNEIVKLK